MKKIHIVVRSLQLRAFIIIIFLCSFSNLLQAQYWHYYNPTLFFDVNAIDILKPGVVAIGGGWETNDSVQVMFQTVDYGLTWSENAHDGPAPWNKSIAFSDTLNGYGVGYDGRIIKSGDGGENWGYPTVPINRNLNKIVYVGGGTYFVVGGNKANDSIQTIIKSTDYGNTWVVKYDTSGSWLKSVYFKDLLNGFVVGDNGVVLATTNGGNTWTPVTVPVQRDFNAITFINANTGYIVGGISTGSCRRTILKTVNGGTSWSVLLDITQGILNDISFADSLVGYIVGDSALVLKTTDGGLNWLPENVDTNLTGTESFNTVYFYTRNFGAIGGKNGVLYVYYNPYPIVSASPATDIGLHSAILNGTINAGGNQTSMKFEYGTSATYGNEIIASPDTTSVLGKINVSAFLGGLIPNTIYHYRLKGNNYETTNYSDDMMFYSGEPEIPNFDFELWDTTAVDFPDGWTQAIGAISKYSPGCNDNYAIKIQNTPDGRIGALTMGKLGDGLNGHGIPFNARPDTLVGCFKYNIDVADTSWVALLLSKNGNPVSKKIYVIVGNSGGNFFNLKFPISYTTSDTPDSLILVLSSSNFNHTFHSPGSWIIIDNIHFTGTSLNIPNNSFEQWQIQKSIDLVSWNYDGRGAIPVDTLFTSVFQTTDAALNKYAAKIKTHRQGNKGNSGFMVSGNNQTKKIPVSSRHKLFTGYFKFFPLNNDTMNIHIYMTKNNDTIGSGYFLNGNMIDVYTPFIVNITYSSPTEIPDSASIYIQAFKGPPLGNSVLYADNLGFEGFFSGIKEPSITIVNNIDFNVYPNPFNEQATVLFNTNKDENVTVRLFDLSGKQVALITNGRFKPGEHKINLSAETLQKGFYICVINTEKAVYSKKLIVY